ncbi:hypothetical protein KAK06_02130 [Ideonella sp. 4Y11]|uniref:Uncharacterized protein n=2 Tax=Sphaerotilaceae TaxID=2975441 RepID=A0A940YED3_9BURK|nr:MULTISPECIES: hypothetical protein [Sphaerotilaceae]MBN8486937.1 hypothetical protein [Burkholderiales bacterium]MBQ0957744.1 hypothetical protein [Ideonella aquatica]URI12020.1 hypothetical protein MW290_32780 [Aquincola tertiaricarbonis]
MRKQIPDADIAQLMLWIWIVVVLVAIALFALWRRWRKAHPPPTIPPKLAYSQTLGKRLATGRRGVGKTKSKRGPPVSGGPRGG